VERAAMPEQLVEIFDRLLELYELRAEAESQRDDRAVRSLQHEIEVLEATKVDMRARETASIH
jgi:hypothetical protein